jgi:hypothetical protein
MKVKGWKNRENERINSPDEAEIECRIVVIPIELISDSGDHIVLRCIFICI